jgi:CRP-like cAMP-binding protein
MKSKRMLAFIGSRFRPWFNHAGTYLYRQGDEINSFFIVISGIAAFVTPKYRQSIFAVVDPSVSDAKSKLKNRIGTLKHLGYEDSVVNHLLLLNDI